MVFSPAALDIPLETRGGRLMEAARKQWRLLAAAFGCWASVSGNCEADQPRLLAPLNAFAAARTAEFSRIPPDRQRQLRQLAEYVERRVAADRPAKLIFVCTHNSRRSQMSQLWAAAAAAKYAVANVEAYSGGTERTAFNPRAVAALQRAGFAIQQSSQDENPQYRVSFARDEQPLICYSKLYHKAPNPLQDYCAVMTCSHADKNCPAAPGAAARVAIPFEDPKIADDTPAEAGRYDERCAQIAREMLYVFSLINGTEDSGT